MPKGACATPFAAAPRIYTCSFASAVLDVPISTPVAISLSDTANEPSASQSFEYLWVGLLKAASLHSLLELLPPRRGIFLDCVLPQQPVHTNPKRPMLRRGDLRAQTAPGISSTVYTRCHPADALQTHRNILGQLVLSSGARPRIIDTRGQQP